MRIIGLPIAFVTLAILTWSATGQERPAVARPDAALGKKDVPPAAQKPAAMDDLPLRLSVTEKVKDQKGLIYYIFVKQRGVFFSADGETLFVQRGGGGGGFGGGVGKQGGAFGPAGAVAGLANSYQEHLSAWSLKSKKKIKDYPGCQAAAVSPSGKSLAMAGVFQKKHSARLVNVATGKVTTEIPLAKHMPAGLAAGASPVTMPGSLVFTPDGKRLAVQPALETLVWEFESGKVSSLKAPTQNLLGFLPDAKTLVFLGVVSNVGGFGLGGVPAGTVKNGEGRICVWELGKGKASRRFGDNAIRGGAISPDGKTVASFSLGQFGFGGVGFQGGAGILGGQPVQAGTAQIQLWDVNSGQVRLTCDTKVGVEMARQKVGNNVGFLGIAGGIQDVTFSPDGRILASCMASGENGFVHLFDVRTGREIRQLKLTFCPQGIAFCRDGSLLATAGGLGPLEIRVWELPSLGELNSPIPSQARPQEK